MKSNRFAKSRFISSKSMCLTNAFAFIVVTTFFVGGCAMCCGPYDYHYPNQGGSVQRSDPVWGRVGSVFSDPGPFGGPSADHNLKPHDSRNSPSDVEDIGNIEPLENGNSESENNGTSGELPPPNNLQRPSPDDDTTSIQRLQIQSQRPQNRWR